MEQFYKNSKNLFKKYIKNEKNLLLVFIIAFGLRLLFWMIFGTYFSFFHTDSAEYFYNSINFEPLKVEQVILGYEHWYERTPAYIIFLHIIQRKLIFQVLISAISCLLMFKMNHKAGWLWTFYLQDIMYSFQFAKETLLIFFVILSIYLFKDNKKWLFVIIPLIILPFSSFGGVITFNHEHGKGFMSNFFKLWEPAFDLTVMYSKWFVYIQVIPYSILLYYFLRNFKIISIEFGFFLMLSIIYGYIYGQPRYREPFMPLLFLYTAEPLYLKSKTAYFNLRTFISQVKQKSYKPAFILEPFFLKRLLNIGKLIPNSFM